MISKMQIGKQSNAIYCDKTVQSGSKLFIITFMTVNLLTLGATLVTVKSEILRK